MLAQDYEMFEIHDPHFLLRHEYATDSAGAGRWRGGLGVETEFRIDGEDVTGIVFGDGVEEEARGFGIFGGKPGGLNAIVITDPRTALAPAAGRRRSYAASRRGAMFGSAPAAAAATAIPANGRSSTCWPTCATGWCRRQAREDYGVVIDPTTCEVDAAATRAIAGEQRMSAPRIDHIGIIVPDSRCGHARCSALLGGLAPVDRNAAGGRAAQSPSSMPPTSIIELTAVL